MLKFNWVHQIGSSYSSSPKVTIVKFGDGYEQRQKNGINNDLKTYSLTFIGLNELINQIDLFLNARGAVESFLWRSPIKNEDVTVVCRSWSITKNGVASNLTATFEEVVA